MAVDSLGEIVFVDPGNALKILLVFISMNVASWDIKRIRIFLKKTILR